jgi:hypothetical protein
LSTPISLKIALQNIQKLLLEALGKKLSHNA